jgi:ABC-2 type transport system permease protein
MRTLRLLAIHLRLALMGALAYRADFIIHFFESLLELGTGLGGLALIFSHTKTLGGWSAPEVVALTGVFFIVGGAVRFAVQPAMESLIESVRDGTLDFTLVKPVDSQLLVSLRRFQIWKLTDILMGLCVLAAALWKLGAGIGGMDALRFAVALLSGGAIVYSFWLMLATLSFWFVRVENILVIFQSLYEAGRWPVNLYPRWLKFILTFLVPVAFATTVPAEALSGRLGWDKILLSVGVAGGLLILSRMFWKIGSRHYSGASA